jgi:translation initiation factor IF-2
MAATGTKLFKVASQINISKDAIVEYLASKGFDIQNKPTANLTDEMVDLVIDKFAKELKVAEKQRAKVQRQQAVRKSLMEGSATVSIDTYSESDAPAPVSGTTPAAPAQPVAETRPDEHAPEASEHVSPAVHEAPEPAVAAPTPVVAEKAATPEQPQPATPVATAPEPPPVVAEAPAAAVAEPSAPATPVAEEKPAGPAVGQVINLEGIGKPPAPPPPPPAPEPAPAESAVAEQSAQPVAAEAAKDETKTEEASGEGDEKRKRKRKGVIEVELKAGGAPKLRGLTVLGKIDIQKKEERPKRTREPDARSAPGKGTIGEAVSARRPQGGSAPGQGGNAPGRSGGQGSPRPGSGPAGMGGGSDAPGNRGTATGRADDKKRRGSTTSRGSGGKEQVNEGDVNRAIRQTLSGMEDRSAVGGRSRIRQKKRQVREERAAIRQEEAARESTTLRLSEFVTTGDLANLMRVTAADIIMKCMGLGLMVSINQRLDRETIELIASDYGFQVEFLDDQEELEVEDEEDSPETLVGRSPIVTIMGHVDHGKTSLLDYIRSANVVAGEAGGITQHIGAYRVEVPGGRHITFLDTPGHEAFTAMRARGAQVTDIVVLVVAADDSVMPQTLEAISHAQAANVPMVVAINKVDKADSNPERIKQQLADQNVLVEEWGGKFQSVALSAKTGMNVDQLLEKILLEADLLELKANPDRAARATVIEAHVDKGRGNVVTIIVQKGTLSVGDIFVCGQFAGRVRAMTDERGNRVDHATPSMPVQVTGFDGLPNAGDVLLEMETDAEAREIAGRRQQLRREQQFRGMRHMTLDDISAQIQQGGVKELRLVVKADVSGSLEALSDSLLKLATPEVQVRIVYRAVGAITESDVMLAAASDAVVVGFQVTTPASVRKLAEAESVDVRLYSIIYDCINEVQLALEGMLTPDIKEEITATVEVRALFKISKVGTIAGCYVQNGTINRNDKVRVLREGFEIFKGTLQSLRRIKDDVREVDAGYECGININGFNDLSIGDIIEAYKTVEVKRKLA